MHILNGFNAEMCLGLTVTLITAPHTDKYAIATIKSYPITGKIFLYLINKSIKKKKVSTMVHFLKTLLQLQKMGHVGVNTPSLSPPIVFNKSSFISRMVWVFFFFKPLLLVFPALPVLFLQNQRKSRHPGD